ncbi:6-phosphogluconate dehydrogenase [Pollutimonas subterranea]|uniref:6-phosphogluconate dehydrogenase n=1 Tax=Pollutimonas subterranea TaxID=2045210 RepID=A0A2N4U8W8_9BURK|nr:NAD(P)-dependent oxidoreductase [Pollutimonas subterranea]PLC51466.1 6-phosphogluconate dehydrogenase [Pollutimonas subterranea]
MNVAIVGCGDVGRCYAKALMDAGHQVSELCDSRPSVAIARYAEEISAKVHSEPGDWLAEVDLVISAVFGGVALDVARQSLTYMHKDSIYADFTTGRPADLRAAANMALEANIEFVDVAITGAIGLGGQKTPLLCAGPATARFVELMKAIGAPIRIVGTEPGDAVALKLLRSIFTKGLEALAVECLMAAEHQGLRQSLYEVLSDIDQTPIRNFMEATVTTHVRHAERRLAEVREARLQLESEGIQPRALDGVAALFEHTANAIQNSPIEGEATIENSLRWLLDQQRSDATKAPTTDH